MIDIQLDDDTRWIQVLGQMMCLRCKRIKPLCGLLLKHGKMAGHVCIECMFPVSEDELLTCPSCGRKTPSEFCEHCGANLCDTPTS